MLGAPLLERRPRQIVLTALGDDLLMRARRILASVDELEDLVRSAQGPLAGRLRLGVIPTIAPYLLPAVIKALSERMPALELQPREAVTQMLISDLLESRLDAAIVALPVSKSNLQELALFKEDFVLLRPMADARKPVPSLSHLKDMRLMLLEEGHCFRDQALSFCEITASRADSAMEGSSLSTLVQMVDAGMGVTLVPEIAIARECRMASVSVARFEPPRPGRTIGMVWRKTSPLAAQLIEIGAVVRGLGQMAIKASSDPESREN